MSDPFKDFSDTETHPSYGMISASRVQGQRQLFGVDYPQHHFIRIKISKGSLRRGLSNDWYSDGNHIVELDLSEVQWARMLSSMNTIGVPCTLAYYRDEAGKFVLPGDPPRRKQRAEMFEEEAREKMSAGLKAVGDALKKVRQMATAGTVRKGDLNEIASAISTAEREILANLPWVISQAEEAVECAVEAGKGEISAFAEFQLTRIGREALGAHLEAIGSTDAATVAAAITHKKEK